MPSPGRIVEFYFPNDPLDKERNKKKPDLNIHKTVRKEIILLAPLINHSPRQPVSFSIFAPYPSHTHIHIYVLYRKIVVVVAKEGVLVTNNDQAVKCGP